MPRETDENNRTDDERADVEKGYKASANNDQTDYEQSQVERTHRDGANKTVSQFTVIEQQGIWLDARHSVADCILADFKLGAGLAKQIKEKFPSFFTTETSTSDR